MCFPLITTNIVITLVWQRVNFKVINAIYHIILFVPPPIILITTEATGYTGWSNGASPCFFAPLKLGVVDNGLLMLLTELPWLLTASWGYLMIAITFFILIRRAGVKAAAKQLRLALFALLYGTCLLFSLIAGTEWLKGHLNDYIVTYFTCLVNNWVASKLHRHPTVSYYICFDSSVCCSLFSYRTCLPLVGILRSELYSSQ